MSNYRSRPKGDYVLEAAWQDLYKLTERWQNNLEFQLNEIEFLERLIDTHFAKLLLLENLDEIRELQREIYHTKNESEALLQRIQIHLKHIIDIIDEPLKYDGSIFRDEHEQLEDNVTEFITKQKGVKLTVFKMTKGVLENEKPKFNWKNN